jgi:hypothetical protein
MDGSMLRLVILLLFTGFIGAILHAQVPSPIQKPQPFVVAGCLQGTRLTTTDVNTSGSTADVYRLRGPRQLMKALREYEGQEVEISGTLKDSDGRLGATRSKQLGNRTRIGIAVREDRTTQQPETPELTVEFFSPHQCAVPAPLVNAATRG